MNGALHWFIFYLLWYYDINDLNERKQKIQDRGRVITKNLFSYFLSHLPRISWIFRSMSLSLVVAVVAGAEGGALDLAQDLLPADGLVEVGQLVVGVQDGGGQDLPRVASSHLWWRLLLIKAVPPPLVQNVSTEGGLLFFFSSRPKIFLFNGVWNWIKRFILYIGYLSTQLYLNLYLLTFWHFIFHSIIPRCRKIKKRWADEWIRVAKNIIVKRWFTNDKSKAFFRQLEHLGVPRPPVLVPRFARCPSVSFCD